MNNVVVRIDGIVIENFKNVNYGEIDFTNKNDYKASILGLYGQNGSGKTTLIDSISLLKFILMGAPVPTSFSNYINVNCEFSTLKYKISINNTKTNESYRVDYSLSIKNAAYLEDFHDSGNKLFKTVVFNETLSCSYNSNSESDPMRPLINTKNSEGAFDPKTKYEILVGNKKDVYTDVLVAKKLSFATSKSFIFSKEFNKIINENCSADKYINLLNSLIHYGTVSLFVFESKNTALVGLNTLPITFKMKNGKKQAVGNILVPIDRDTVIHKDDLSIVEKVVDNMNIVLEQLVPGLTISVKTLGEELKKDGQIGSRIQMLSHKNNKAIPLRYESEGIKKIVAMLQLLIVVYNQASITVAIDELDSGIFEYLLGEILKIISEKGKGQLIFTSHNLRPLETLDKSFIAFTTINPNNRYIRFTNVKSKNNLRDFYYRDIVLGGQSEPVYERTNNNEIAYAFKEAGKFSGE